MNTVNSVLTQGPAIQAISMISGDTMIIPLYFSIDEVPIDFTDYQFFAVLEDQDSSIDLDVAIENQTLSKGYVTVTISSTISASLNGRYSWKVWWLDGDLNKRTVIQGGCDIRGS